MPRKQKKYHYIYKTICSLTKRYYYGMHSTNNLNDGYIGSGSELSRSIKKYGKETHSKKILEYLDNRKKLRKRESEIVNKKMLQNPLCMNLCKGGGSNDFTGLIVVKDKNGKTFSVSVNDSRYLSGELLFISTGMVNVKDKNGNKFQVSIKDPRYLSGELVGVTKGMITIKDKKNNAFLVSINDPRYLNGELIGVAKGLIVVKDKNGKTFSVSVNDPRYLSGELVHHLKGKVTVKNKNGDKFRVNIKDPRYLSGELVGLWKGKKHREKTKRKIGEKNSITQKGERNSQFGTCWIYNLELKKNNKIKKKELNFWINNGWQKGRKMMIIK